MCAIQMHKDLNTRAFPPKEDKQSMLQTPKPLNALSLSFKRQYYCELLVYAFHLKII